MSEAEAVDAWGEAKKQAKAASGGGAFLKLVDDGDKAQGAILGDPLPYTKVRDFGGKAKKSKRFAVAFYLVGSSRADEKPGMRVFEMSAETLLKLASAREEIDFKTTLVKIKRVGAKGSTDTTYQIFAGPAIPKEIFAEIAACKPVDLSGVATRAEEDAEESSAGPKVQNGMGVESSELPF